MAVPKGWIVVTQITGPTVTVNIQQIVCVRLPLHGEFPAAAQSVVEYANGKLQAVTEPLDTVVQQITNNS
jgi:hypothetical protein